MAFSRAKSLAAALGVSAVAMTGLLSVEYTDHPPPRSVAGGSGDSATGTSFVAPTLPVMSLDPTIMSTGATITATVPATALATEMASPTYKASPEAVCVNNGQCP